MMVRVFYMLPFGDKNKAIGCIGAYRLLISTDLVLKLEIASCFQVVFIHC